MALAFNKIRVPNFAFEEAGPAGNSEPPPTFQWGIRAVVVEIDVLNESVYMSILTSMSGECGDAQWEQELWLSPQHRTISRQGIFGIRFRRAETESAEPAPVVTVQAIGESESWPNLTQLGGPS